MCSKPEWVKSNMAVGINRIGLSSVTLSWNWANSWYPSNADKYKCCKSSAWLGQGSNPRPPTHDWSWPALVLVSPSCLFRIMRLFAIWGNGSGGLVSQWNSTIQAQWVHTVTSTCSNVTLDLFVVVLRYSNNISVISWQSYDVWDEKGKAWAYIFTDFKGSLTSHTI